MFSLLWHFDWHHAGAGLSGVHPLLAYLDPGSGSMALQVVIAGLLSGAFFLKTSWVRVRTWISAARLGR